LSADANAVPSNNQYSEFIEEPGMIFMGIESDEDETFENFQSKVLRTAYPSASTALCPHFEILAVPAQPHSGDTVLVFLN
jgi:hypothetical protein